MEKEKIRVSTDRLDDFEKKLHSETQRIQASYNDIVSEYRKIGGYWKSEYWETVNANFASNTQTMDTILSELSSFEGTIHVAAAEYRSTEKANRNMLDSLPSDVIR